MRLSLIGFLGRRLVSAVLVGLLAAPAIGQTTTALIVGTVYDESTLALPGATVTAKNVNTGLIREAISSETGTYRLAGLPSGRYEIAVSLVGFADQVRPDVSLILGQEQTVNFTLKLAGMQESVTVTGVAPLIEAARTAVGAAVIQEQILALPLGSRTFTDLALILPGVNADQRRQWSDPVNVGAGSWNQTSFQMDGVANVWVGTGESRMNFMQDAVQEFKVLTSGFNAEQGFSASGVVLGVSKSGGNAFRGSGSYFYRDKALNTKGYFETVKQPYHRQQYGGTMGGPILRDRLFFFAGIERLDEQTSGFVSTGGVYPSLEGQFPQEFLQTLGTFRADATFSPAHSGFFRYAVQKRLKTNTRAGGNLDVTAAQDFDYPRYSVATGLTSVIGSGIMVNDFRVGFSETDGLQTASRPGLQAYTFDSLTYGQISGYQPVWEQRLEIANDITIQKSGWGGGHSFKMGVSLNPYVPQGGNTGNSCTNGCYRIAGDVPGFPKVPIPWETLYAQGRITQLTLGLRPEQPRINFPLYSAYVQDTWKPVSNLTLNLGVRYDYQINITATHKGQPFVGTFKIPGVYDRSTRKPDRNNLAPRFGFAYTPTDDAKTVIRGSAGLFYGLVTSLTPYGEWKQQDGATVASVTILKPHLTNWENPLAEIDPKALASGTRNFNVMANDAVSPEAFQGSMGFSRELAPNLGLDVDYLHVQGWNIGWFCKNINAPHPVTKQKLAPQYNVINQCGSTGRDLYNALLVKVEKRLSNNLTLMVSYTLGKADNMMSGQSTTAADHNRVDDEYGPATADRRQRLVFSGITSALPGDLQFSWVLSTGTPRPFDILAGRDLNGDTAFNDRPVDVTRNQGCRDLDLAALNAFRQAQGVSAVDSVACPTQFNVDARLGKNFRLGGNNRLELFFEAYNLTNFSNLQYSETQTASWVEQALSRTFGKALSAGLPRQAAVAARFSF